MFVIATAGHVDHGKSTLILHLTGTNPDRLVEEQQRGLTIDLGFAATTLPSGIEVGFVDVPGHSHYIRNMLAGLGGIAGSLFVVAATEVWKPQSEEHLRILDLLDIRKGTIALSKVGLVDSEWQQLAELEIADHVAGTFLESAEIVPVDVPSAVGTEGENSLIAALDRMLATTPPADDLARPRLWIDRAFAISGAGTVVTGTLTGGSIRLGERLVIEPGTREIRVRGLQSHGRTLEQATPGSRVAINLTGVTRDQIHRGNAIVRPNQWHQCRMFDASLHVLAGLEFNVGQRGAYFVYLGSGEHSARLRVLNQATTIEPGDIGFVRLRLPEALPLVPGDRYILRDAGRNLTVGGGEILDVAPILRLAKARPSRDISRVIAERGWVDHLELERLTGIPSRSTVGHWVVDPSELDHMKAELYQQLRDVGPLGADIGSFDEKQRAVIGICEGLVVSKGGRVNLASSSSEWSNTSELEKHQYLLALINEPFSPPPPPHDIDRLELRILEQEGLIANCSGVWFAMKSLEAAGREVALLLVRSPEGVTVSEFRSALNTTRKFAMPILTYLDATGVTRRRGEFRIGGPKLPEIADTNSSGERSR